MIQDEVEDVHVSQNKNMNEFIEEAHMNSQMRQENFVQGNLQTDSFTKTNVVQPDDADEESMQGQIINALANQEEDYKI